MSNTYLNKSILAGKTSLKKNGSAVIHFSTSEVQQKLPSPAFVLPKPSLDGNIAQVDSKVGSVFCNPFLEEEAKKEAILERHVKMVDTKSNMMKINGKRICWNYRKGKCRFGHNCKYAHDSDLLKTKEELEAENDSARATSVVCQGTHLQNSTVEPQQSTENSSQDLDQTEEELSNKKKRKRPGLTQGLIPGKKVMQGYLKYKT